LDVEVAARPDATDKLAELADPQKNMIPQLAILGLSITKQMEPVVSSLREPWGVMVAAVLPNPVAANVDLQQGDVIHSVNTLVVTSVEALRESLDALRKGDAVVLQVEREGGLRYVGYRVE
jgi:S1-C subfamily serine protease